MIPSDPEVSKWNQSRWPSICTGFYGHHVMWNSHRKDWRFAVRAKSFALHWRSRGFFRGHVCSCEKGTATSSTSSTSSNVTRLTPHSCMPLQQLPTVTKDACEHAQVLCTCSGQANGALNMSTLYMYIRSALFGACLLGHRFRVGVVLRIRGWRVVRKLVLPVLLTLPPTSPTVWGGLVRGQTEVAALLFTLTFQATGHWLGLLSSDTSTCSFELCLYPFLYS